MRTTKYMPFTRKKRLFDKNMSQKRGAAAPNAPPAFESATAVGVGFFDVSAISVGMWV